MPVPDFQTLLLPMLRACADGQPRSIDDLRTALQHQFNLTDADLAERLRSGRSKFANRVDWASIYFVKVGILDRVSKGVFRITDRGRNLLQEEGATGRITLKTLSRYREFADFQKPLTTASASESAEESAKTPEELLESSHQSMRQRLAAEVLDAVRNVSPAFFEKLVVDLLVAMGYGGTAEDAGQAVGGSGDGGVDGIIKEDKLGLDAVYVQAKRWSGTVGRPVVQAFAGSLEGHRARKGVLITTSDFSADAKEYVEKIEKRIVLIGGQQLAEYMIDHDVGVAAGRTYTVKRLDQDYFDDV
jgi:restriction system protein